VKRGGRGKKGRRTGKSVFQATSRSTDGRRKLPKKKNTAGRGEREASLSLRGLEEGKKKEKEKTETEKGKEKGTREGMGGTSPPRKRKKKEKKKASRGLTTPPLNKEKDPYSTPSSFSTPFSTRFRL